MLFGTNPERALAIREGIELEAVVLEEAWERSWRSSDSVIARLMPMARLGTLLW
jgi:hypothetical protein